MGVIVQGAADVGKYSKGNLNWVFPNSTSTSDVIVMVISAENGFNLFDQFGEFQAEVSQICKAKTGPPFAVQTLNSWVVAVVAYNKQF